MPNETPTGPAEAPDSGRHSGGGSGHESPLQTRAAFVENWDWQSVVLINRGTCERGRAQHGFNSETAAACERDWEARRHTVVTLAETFDELKSFHRRAPFLFFNGNTFAAIARRLAAVVFADLPTSRLREITSAVAHYIAGVLDREAMVAIVEELSDDPAFQPGDHVKTLRGSNHGVVRRLLADGRVVWQPDGGAELMALPESLLPDNR